MDVPDLPPLTLLAIPGFVAAMIAEIAIGWWTRRVRYETRDTLASLCMGAGNVLEGLVAGFVAATVYAACYRLAPFEIPFSIATIALCFVLDDLRYYWFHRLSHEHRWLWAAHVNHHSSQHYNLSTALRQTWTGTVALSFVFRIPLLLLGFHPVMLAFVGSMNLIYQFWIHTEAIGTLPRPIEAIFNTPSHHRVHHARNPRYLDANYAGTFIVWDRPVRHLRPRGRSRALPLRPGRQHRVLQPDPHRPARVGRDRPRRAPRRPDAPRAPALRLRGSRLQPRRLPPHHRRDQGALHRAAPRAARSSGASVRGWGRGREKMDRSSGSGALVRKTERPRCL